MIATAGRRCRRATASSLARAQSSTLVASTTVSRPRLSRMARMRWSRSKASSVAAWACGSSVMTARSASDESTSVGRKCRAAKVDLPLAAIPIRRTSASAGIGRETNRPPVVSAVGDDAMRARGSALGVAVRAHLGIGDRRLRLAGRSRERSATYREAGLANEMDLAEVSVRQAPGHVLSLASGGRGHRAELRLRRSSMPEIGDSHNPRESGSMAVTT